MTAFNPLDKLNLAESVARALLEKPLDDLDTIDEFEGAGIYAIYYGGSHPAYTALTATDVNDPAARPIYVGKAVAEGARRGGYLHEPVTYALSRRLREHAASVRAATNLAPRDFRCRHLVVEGIWIPLGETLIIERFRPVWNVLIDGFGNHDPGGGRRAQERSPWDVLHSGRGWAERQAQARYTAQELEEQVRIHLAGGEARVDRRRVARVSEEADS